MTTKAKRPKLDNLKKLNARSALDPEPALALDSPVKPKSSLAPSRVGRAHIGGYFSESVKRQLRILAAEQNKTTQALIGEALNLLFSNYGKAEIADEGD